MRMPRTARPLITSEDFATLRDEWAALHAAIRVASPFTHPDWHACWLRHFGRAFDAHPVYLAVRREEQLIGVLALDMAAGIARTLGDPNVRDYGGPLVLPGAEHDVARCVLEWMLEDMTPGLDLWGIAAATRLHEAFAEAATYWGWKLEAEPESVCPAVDLPADFETYVTALAKHDRHELRRKLRNLEAVGEIHFETATAPEAVAAQMDTLLAMMHASRADKAEFLTPQMESFFRDLATTFAETAMTRLSTLTLDGTAVATIFAFDSGGVRYLYNSGYDRAHNHLAVGLLSKALSIREAIAANLTRFDFLRGDEPYKSNLGGHPQEIVALHFRR